MGKIIKDTIHANGIDIGIYTQDFKNEFISLTDIARYKSGYSKLDEKSGCDRIFRTMGKVA